MRLPRPGPIADLSPEHSANCSLGRPAPPRDIPRGATGFAQSEHSHVAPPQRSLFLLKGIYTGESRVGFLGFDGKERSDRAEKRTGVTIVPDTKMVLILPIGVRVSNILDRADSDSLLNPKNEVAIRTSNGYVESSRWEMNTALSVEESSEPNPELPIAPIIEHSANYSGFTVPLPMARAIARAVAKALEQESTDAA